MLNRSWVLGVSVLAMTVFAAADAYALKGFDAGEANGICPPSKQSCCAAKNPSQQVGAFSLAGVSADKAQTRGCSMRQGHCPIHTGKCPVTQLLDAPLVAGPFILTGAVLNDAYLLLTMPYRKSEPLS